MATEVQISTQQAESNIQDLEDVISSLTSEINSLTKAENELKTAMSGVSGATEEQTKELKRLQSQQRKTSSEIKTYNDKLKTNKKALTDQTRATDLSTQSSRDLARMFGGPLGRTLADISEGMEKFGNVSFRAFVKGAAGAQIFRIALISTGVLAFIVAIGSLVAWFLTAEKGAAQFRDIMRSLFRIIEPLWKLILLLGEGLAGVLTGFKDYDTAIDQATIRQDKFNESLKETERLLHRQSAEAVDAANTANAVQDLRSELAKTDTEDFNERLRLLNEILKLETDIESKLASTREASSNNFIATAEGLVKEVDIVLDQREVLAGARTTAQKIFGIKGDSTIVYDQFVDDYLELGDSLEVFTKRAQDAATASNNFLAGAIDKTTQAEGKLNGIRAEIQAVTDEQAAYSGEVTETTILTNKLAVANKEAAEAEKQALKDAEAALILENRLVQAKLANLAVRVAPDSTALSRFTADVQLINDLADIEIAEIRRVGEARGDTADRVASKEKFINLQRAKEIQDTTESYKNETIAAELAIDTAKETAHQRELARIREEQEMRLASASSIAASISIISSLQEQSSVEFKALAITATLINGAVAAIRAIRDLGPIGGPIAAALIGAATIATVAKIESYETGGFTGYGLPNEEAGTVHKGEYVVPAPVLNTTIGSQLVAGLEGLRTGSNIPQQGNIADQVVAGLRRSPIFVRVKDIVDESNSYVKVIDSASY